MRTLTAIAAKKVSSVKISLSGPRRTLSEGEETHAAAVGRVSARACSRARGTSRRRPAAAPVVALGAWARRPRARRSPPTAEGDGSLAGIRAMARRPGGNDSQSRAVAWAWWGANYCFSP